MEFEEEVFCTFEIEGTHNWPACPFDEVAYLRAPHRHMFHVKAHKEVTHSDRDVEFIMLKHEMINYMLRKWASDGTKNQPCHKVCGFGAMSCEMIAKDLIERFDLLQCEVSEDGENGAVVRPIRETTFSDTTFV